MAEPRDLAERAETSTPAPGREERFDGYGIMGLPFLSGHVLAMRRFASSLGPRYTSVWHRAPQREWTFYSDVPALMSCNRYFGSAVEKFVQAEIELRWVGPRSMLIQIPAERFTWSIELAPTAFTRAMNLAGPLMPSRLLRRAFVLELMARVAGGLLGAGRLRLHGRAPNGQSFIANPRSLWVVAESSASLAGVEFGPPGPLPRQAFLGDFAIPQRGLFAAGLAFFETFDPARHLPQATRAA